MIVFETARLIVRYFRESDLDDFFLLNGDAEVMRYIRAAQTREMTRLMISQAIAKYREQPFEGRWAIEEKGGGFIGSFAIIPVENSDLTQLGYALLKKTWGKGYATELTREGLKHVFARLDLDKIVARAERGNIASQRVLLKAGFREEQVETENGKEVVQFIFRREDMNQLSPGK